MTTQGQSTSKYHKNPTIALCLNCALPDCDDADPRCPVDVPFKRRTREEKIAHHIVRTELREARRECRA